MKRRPLLIVGQAPPSSGCKRPFPPHTPSGKKLAALLGVDDVLHVADAVNLIEKYPGKHRVRRGDRFPFVRACRAADALAADLARWKKVMLAGRQVASAFGYEDVPFLEWFSIGKTQAVVLPHPSGLNQWWNDAANEARARQVLLSAVS